MVASKSQAHQPAEELNVQVCNNYKASIAIHARTFVAGVPIRKILPTPPPIDNDPKVKAVSQ
ncbi:MAG: hypothetical protein WBN95_10850 [Gammaproteobacteria bacterium]